MLGHLSSKAKCFLGFKFFDPALKNRAQGLLEDVVKNTKNLNFPFMFVSMYYFWIMQLLLCICSSFHTYLFNGASVVARKAILSEIYLFHEKERRGEVFKSVSGSQCSNLASKYIGLINKMQAAYNANFLLDLGATKKMKTFTFLFSYN